MSESSVGMEVAKILASGAVGALAATLAQYLSSRSADRRHVREIKQRERELWAQLAVSPLGPRRMEAFEHLYDRIQNAIETKRISIDEYLLLRPKLLYVPTLRKQLLSALSDLLEATRTKDEMLQTQVVHRLGDLQANLEVSLGLSTIDEGVRSIAQPEGGQ